MRDTGINGVQGHEFRSIYADGTADQSGTPKEVADKALAHEIPNAVKTA